ncbi:MAG: type IV toxin-antitoxin system AbiEi family antitoxin domain-containing protein [Alphaproteobacteria bacterium]
MKIKSSKFLTLYRTVLFGGERESLLAWFRHKDWGTSVEYYTTSFLPADIELVDLERKNFSVKAFSPARAILECYELMEILKGSNSTSLEKTLP